MPKSARPFSAWEDPNPEIGPRLAEFEGLPLHPIFRRPYFGGAWRLHSVRRPASIIPGISEELEALLLRAIGLELDAYGRIETLRRDISLSPIEGRTVKATGEEMNRRSTLHEDLISYHDALRDLRYATRISVRPYRPRVVAAPSRVKSSLAPLTPNPSEALSPGDTLDGYILRRKIANGTFCCVYEAVDAGEGSVCAIKIGKPSGQIDGEPTRLYGAPTKEHHTEAKMFITGGTCGVPLSSVDVLAKQAVHLNYWDDPGVVRLQKQVILEDMPYLCLEYLPGLTLRQSIRKNQADPQVLVQILEALERLAGSSPIPYHGDLKPENIIVTTTGAKMIDPGYFGELAGESNVAITTKAYYPRLEPDDLFACGLILWEITLNYHPLLDHCAEFDSETIAPNFEEAMCNNRFGIQRSFLESLSMVKRPSLVNPKITPTTEDFLLMAIGLRRLGDGRIDLGEGFNDFRELKDALIQQMTMI